MRWNAAFLLFGALMSAACPTLLWAAGECPQIRTTPAAPAEFLVMSNPVPSNEESLKAGEHLYQLRGKPVTCQTCHGRNGDGISESAYEKIPAPRNFTCAETMNTLADGQLFWIIRNGSPHTAMYPFPAFSDKQVWQLVHYLRRFLKPQ